MQVQLPRHEGHEEKNKFCAVRACVVFFVSLSYLTDYWQSGYANIPVRGGNA
jgi:hypothetical protein